MSRQIKSKPTKTQDRKFFNIDEESKKYYPATKVYGSTDYYPMVLPHKIRRKNGRGICITNHHALEAA